MKTLTQHIQESKSDYEVYHQTYTSAVTETKSYLEKNKFNFDEEEFSKEFGLNNSRPKNGDTVKINMVVQSGARVSTWLHVQITDLGTRYELNLYTSKGKN